MIYNSSEGSGVRLWIQISAVLLTDSVSFKKLLNLFESLFPWFCIKTYRSSYLYYLRVKADYITCCNKCMPHNKLQWAIRRHQWRVKPLTPNPDHPVSCRGILISTGLTLSKHSRSLPQRTNTDRPHAPSQSVLQRFSFGSVGNRTGIFLNLRL